MRYALIILSAIVVAGVVVFVGRIVIEPSQPLLVSAEFSLQTITPNADGNDDITEYRYEISENARVSIALINESGRVFAFRQDEARAKGEYSGLFSGVVDGYVLEGESFGGEVMRRLIPDGIYTWEIRVVNDDGETDSQSGTLVIAEADAELPDLSTFTISPALFTPNQDGIQDRTQINVVLEKDADIDVYLLTEDGVQLYIPPEVNETRDGESGRYTYDYDGGVDGGADPPPDGVYTIVATAQDAVGQRVERRETLTIADGGKPLAEIASQPIGADVVWSVIPYDGAYASSIELWGERIALPDQPQDANQNPITMLLGDVLVFRLTVENYSDVPIRTHGAPPGTVYEQIQRAATLGTYDQSGAWRVGIDCDTAVSDYPWRWALGDESTLQVVQEDETGNTFYYIPPGERAVVWGGIRMTELIESRNPQNCWAGLIHEDVEVSIRNSRVGARSIELVDVSLPLYKESESE